MGIFERWFAKTPSSMTFGALPAPEEPLFVIGDIHGRMDLLDRILTIAPKQARLIFVGDLIDRGEESDAVLDRVRFLCADGAVCLMGNHEKMLLDFLARPTERGLRWLRYGGLQTLQSYGIGGLRERARPEELLFARDRLEAAMSVETIRWIKALPLRWVNGNINVVHAAADPKIAMDSQNPHALLWGILSFEQHTRCDGQWVVHGHTIVETAVSVHGRVAVDTGAYATGALSAAYIANGKIVFMTA